MGWPVYVEPQPEPTAKQKKEAFLKQCETVGSLDNVAIREKALKIAEGERDASFKAAYLAVLRRGDTNMAGGLASTRAEVFKTGVLERLKQPPGDASSFWMVTDLLTLVDVLKVVDAEKFPDTDEI